MYIYLGPIGAGGPLGPSGYTSTESTLFGNGHTDANGMWISANTSGGSDTLPTTNMWNFDYTNFVMECWILPLGNGCLNGPPFGNQRHSQFLCTGSGEYGGRNGGARFVIDDDALGNPNSVQITAQAIGPDATNNFNIGNSVTLDTNRWMHLAVVVDSSTGNAITTFYVNGVPHGASTTNNLDPAGHFLTPAIYPTTPYFGSGQDTPNPYWGYLDEMRFSYFDPGQFSVNDLLTRTTSGPSITGQPQSTTAWAGGTAPFKVTTVYDTSTTYQWQRGGINISGATSNPYVADPVTVGDSGAQFDCKVTASSVTVTSSNATLTVIANNPANVAAYRSLVTGNPNLKGYYPADDDSGSTLTDTVDHTYNGTLELNAYFDGRTNVSFGQRAVAFNGDGDVQIPFNPDFEFSDGEGTIEAVIYEDPAAQYVTTDHTILAEAADPAAPNYYLRASANGSFLKYGNSGGSALSWVAPASLLGQFAHVAVVIHQNTNVTAYINGVNLGTQTQNPSANLSGQFWIGSMGTIAPDNWWFGSVDEVAFYNAALSQTTVQQHYSAFVFGTNTSGPSIVSEPASRTVLAGASPTLTVKASGTLPLTYQWLANNVAIPGANAASLMVSNITATTSYVLNVQNAYGQTNSDPIVVTTTAPPAGYLSKIMADGPSALWRLAETTGAVAVDSAGFNDGTYYGGVTLGGSSFPNATDPAAKFDGSTGRAVVPSLGGPAIPALNPQGSFSIEYWAEVDNYAFRVPISSMNRPSRDSGYEFYLFGNFPGFEWHDGPGGYNAYIGSPDVPAVGTWYHVVGVFDLSGGGNGVLRMYINGVENDSAGGGQAGLGSPYVANTILPLYIGSRSDNGNFWSGSLADVALYNYVLTTNQIANHYSAVNSAAAITQSPTGGTFPEGVTTVITLTAMASGTPNTYQWVKDGGNLAAVNNADGTAHYPALTGAFNTISQGVNGPTLVINEARPSDSGSYHLVVNNPLGGATSGSASVTVTPDTTLPAVTSVQALGTPNTQGGLSPFLVKVLFSKRIDMSAGTYTIPGATVTSFTVPAAPGAAVVAGDSREAILNTTGLTPGQTYTVTVSGVKDQAQTPNTIVTTNLTFKAPPLTQGTVAWDYYYLGPAPSGTTFDIAYLQANQDFPNAPQTNWASTTFDSTPITTGDYNNVPGIGAAGDYYGDSLSGWITPTVTTNYYFFIASDDASELDLNPSGADPQGAFMIATAVCCNGFQEPGNTSTGGPFLLNAGTPYFLRALHVEGGGGDYVKVAWRMDGDTNAAASLKPITGAYLSSYALSPAPPAFNPVVFSNGQLSISWTGAGTLVSSPDVTLPLSQWTTVTTTSPYVVTPATGAPRMFYRVKQ